MDNASRAITIAGGILIAILLISLVMYFATSYRDFFSGVANSKQTMATLEFNRFYTESMYNGGKLFGYDALNIINRAKEVNNDPNSPIYIGINGTKVATLEAISDLNPLELTSGERRVLKDLYNYSYELDKKTGYVYSITIE